MLMNICAPQIPTRDDYTVERGCLGVCWILRYRNPHTSWWMAVHPTEDSAWRHADREIADTTDFIDNSDRHGVMW